MKAKRIILEVVGIILAVSGAILFVSSLMPLINPGFVKVSMKREASISSSDIVLLIASLGILCGGIVCSRRASKLKKREDMENRESDDEK